MPVLNGYLYYTTIQTPKKKYEAEGKEYSVDVLVEDESVAKTWNKTYKKQKAKDMSAAEFKAAYKVDPPFESEDDTYYIIKVKRDAQYKDGTPIKPEHTPKVFMTNAKGKLTDVTATTLVGNGSQGGVSYRENQNDYGLFAKLDKGVRVDTLVPYVGASDPTGGLGDLDDGSDDFEDAPAPTKSKPASTKPKATKTKVDEEEQDPFA